MGDESSHDDKVAATVDSIVSIIATSEDIGACVECLFGSLIMTLVATAKMREVFDAAEIEDMIIEAMEAADERRSPSKVHRVH